MNFFRKKNNRSKNIASAEDNFGEEKVNKIIDTPVPDMQELEISIDTDAKLPDGCEIEVKEKEDIPVKGILSTDNLVKRYGKRTVVNHVSINVTQGEIVGLLGPNGAGKTTTFYMTTGLITANEGKDRKSVV